MVAIRSLFYQNPHHLALGRVGSCDSWGPNLKDNRAWSLLSSCSYPIFAKQQQPGHVTATVLTADIDILLLTLMCKEEMGQLSQKKFGRMQKSLSVSLGSRQYTQPDTFKQGAFICIILKRSQDTYMVDALSISGYVVHNGGT